jgi:hypothetical protein
MSPAPRSPLHAALWFVGGIFTRNVHVKLAALLLAFLVWMTVSQDITQMWTANQVTVRLDLAEELLAVMDNVTDQELQGDFSVEFQGPASQISDLERAGTTELVLRVDLRDLGENQRATIAFRADQGNIRHLGGEGVTIKSLSPETIEVHVARRGTPKDVRVEQPQFVGELRDWVVDGFVLNPTVRVRGPADELAGLQSVRTEPVRADVSIEQHGKGRESFEVPLRLKLAPQYAERHITLAGDGIEFRASFRRSRQTEEIEIPIFIAYRRPAPSLIVELESTPNILDLETGTIRLNFRGTEGDLAATRKLVEDGSIYAVAWAHQAELYAKGTANPDNPVDFISLIEISDVQNRLPSGVDFDQPVERLQVRVTPRVE